MKFSDTPGMHERQLMRKYQNPLFGDSQVTMDDLLVAQQQDQKEIETFMCDFRELVKEAVALDENADPDVILKLKEQLDKSYEKCSGLAGDQSEIKEMLTRLISAIMQAMWKGIGNDHMAKSKLEMEEQARQAHYRFLEHKIVSDILRPDSVIEETDLVATLLSEDKDELLIAFQIFQPEQQTVICEMAREKIMNLDDGLSQLNSFKDKLAGMEAMLQAGNSMPV